MSRWPSNEYKYSLEDHIAQTKISVSLITGTLIYLFKGISVELRRIVSSILKKVIG